MLKGRRKHFFHWYLNVKWESFFLLFWGKMSNIKMYKLCTFYKVGVESLCYRDMCMHLSKEMLENMRKFMYSFCKHVCICFLHIHPSLSVSNIHLFPFLSPDPTMTLLKGNFKSNDNQHLFAGVKWTHVKKILLSSSVNEGSGKVLKLLRRKTLRNT